MYQNLTQNTKAPDMQTIDHQMRRDTFSEVGETIEAVSTNDESSDVLGVELNKNKRQNQSIIQ